MSTSEADPTEPGTDTTKPEGTPSDTAPAWVTDLKRTLEELPGKLSATLTDDDKGGIAEAVHGLFERSGAFEKGSDGDSTEGEGKDKDKDKDKDTEVSTEESPPTKTGKLSGFAKWFSGEG